jgi:hypothetical protein
MAWITPSVKGETEHQAAPGGSGFEFWHHLLGQQPESMGAQNGCN